MSTFTTRGFLFDMDGTLVDSTAVVEEVWGEVADRYGLVAQEVYDFGHGRQSRVTIDHFLGHLPLTERVRLAEWVGREEETRVDGVVAIEGAAQLLDRLAALTAPVALVTSAHHALALARMTAGGLAMPSPAVTAERVENSKPAPDGYLLGARELGLAATECVGFEDAPAGIAAVAASGATLVVVGEGAAVPTEVVAEHRVRDLTGVRVEREGDGFRVSL